MAIVLNGTTGITAPDIDVTAQASDITTTGDITAVDATLSGGVYLGGTGSANYLDDYETGTWTPVDQSGAGLTFTVYNATYTKVGNVVTVWAQILFPTTSDTSDVYISGLPFGDKTGRYYTDVKIEGQTSPNMAYIYTSGYFRLYNYATNRLNNNNISAKRVFIGFTYETA